MQGTHGATQGGGDLRSSIETIAAQARFVVNVGADGESAVLRLAGEFDLSNAEAAQACLEKALGQSKSGHVVIDMRDLTFIDSTGIAFLVRAFREHGHNLAIRESDATEVKRVLGLVGIPEFVLSAGASVEDR